MKSHLSAPSSVPRSKANADQLSASAVTRGYALVPPARAVNLQAQPVQMAGENIQVDRDTYIARGGDKLEVDPEWDAALQEQIELAMAYINTGADLGEKIALLITYIHEDIPYSKIKRAAAYVPDLNGVKSAELGELLEKGATVCREKSVFCQLLLAQLGIRSRVVSAKKRNSQSGHAWVELTDLADAAIDPTRGSIKTQDQRRANYENFSVHEANASPIASPGLAAQQQALLAAIDKVTELKDYLTDLEENAKAARDAKRDELNEEKAYMVPEAEIRQLMLANPILLQASQNQAARFNDFVQFAALFTKLISKWGIELNQRENIRGAYPQDYHLETIIFVLEAYTMEFPGQLADITKLMTYFTNKLGPMENIVKDELRRVWV